MSALHPDFLRRPIAHRGLHSNGVPENTMAAFQAAIDAGYGIELDIQPAADGTPLVFHDYVLDRLTASTGPVAALTTDQAGATQVLGTKETVPTLSQVLDLVAGRVPLLIEIKDQDKGCGPNVGDLQDRVAGLLNGYKGPVAVMSFNPHTVSAFHRAAPWVACGLTSCAMNPHDWPQVDPATRERLARLADFAMSGASFTSHDRKDLQNPAVVALRDAGTPILSWTIRSAEQAQDALKGSDNITFEGFPA
ncbi:MAG: phosphodiesterase [Paracoccus denitrificans]|nr:MAG: phosphodiesterase [Paracoccus denitrificans]PZO84915.1 MAG: phosphodiesterase [Paracoccus denitrificans]